MPIFDEDAQAQLDRYDKLSWLVAMTDGALTLLRNIGLCFV